MDTSIVRPVKSVRELKLWLAEHTHIIYKAPLDSHPGVLRVKRVTFDYMHPERSELVVYSVVTRTLHLNIWQHIERVMVPVSFSSDSGV